MTLKITRRFYFGLSLLLFLSACLVACDKYTDLSIEQPYAEAIRKYFILQQDYYIFKFSDENDLVIGKAAQLPKDIDSRYIGSNFSNIKIIGIAKSGQLFQIEKITKKKTIEDTYYTYSISLHSLNNNYLYKINASLLCNSMKNPPFTKTWSDPPIFNPKAALPLPSDGIWWK